MLIPSRKLGFIRAGLNGRFGVTVAEFGVGGGYDNLFLNDVEAGDAAAGAEFCAVVAAQMSSGVLRVHGDGSVAFYGAADGTYSQAYPLYVKTPGPSAVVERQVSGGGQQTLSITVGASAAGGASSTIAVSNAGAGVGAEASAGGSSSAVAVSNAGSGIGSETTAGGSSSAVAVSNAGSGVAREAAAGGASTTVAVSNAGSGAAAESGAGASNSTVAVSSVGSGSAQQDGAGSGSSSSKVEVSSVGSGFATERAAGASNSTVAVVNVGAGLALEIVVGSANSTIAVSSAGSGFSSLAPDAGGSASQVVVSASGVGVAVEIAVGGSSSVVQITPRGFGFVPQVDALPLDIFTRMSAMVLKTFGKPSYFNGGSTPVKINIEHNVQLAGMGAEQAAYRGDYVANRDVATIESSLNPEIGDRFVQDGVQYRLEALVKDNGVNRRFVVSRVRS